MLLSETESPRSHIFKNRIEVTLPPTSDFPKTNVCSSAHPSACIIFSIRVVHLVQPVRKTLRLRLVHGNASSEARQYGFFVDFEISFTEYDGPFPLKMSSRSASGK